ncbi:hypothetical protein KOM07_12595 [Lentilactobacillus sp. G22-6]|uniref:DUF5776 domain-containing protein n=1 Tax=Lentilactobacillus dabitei TaxID=2831523 RepID=UPI001C26B9D3|nr:hypothetical protein [Lentilactobacillus dabitei]
MFYFLTCCISIVNPSYKNANLTNRRDRIAKGKTLRIKKVTTGNATRYQLANGNYISANKQLVIWK